MSASGPVSQHAAHVGTLLGPMLLISLWASWSELQAWRDRRQARDVPQTAVLAAGLSVGAAVIHAAVVAPHLNEDVVYGGFFAALAVAQLCWAALVVVRRTSLVVLGGAAANAAVVGLWALTRTVGIPLGTEAGQREAVGLLDVGCGLLELGVVACCLLMLHRRLLVLQPAAA